jgi:hypothetical protein
MEKEFRRFFAIEPLKKFSFAIGQLELVKNKNNLTGQILFRTTSFKPITTKYKIWG